MSGYVLGYDMSTFIRRYARYLNEKAITYRAMAFDFCKVKRGRDDGLLRTMNSEKVSSRYSFIISLVLIQDLHNWARNISLASNRIKIVSLTFGMQFASLTIQSCASVCFKGNKNGRTH